jgi:hypothetical protein
MFKKLQRKKFNNRLERALKQRDRSSVNSTVKTVGILFDGNLIKDLSYFKSLFSSLKISEKNGAFLGIVTFDKNEPSLSKHLCTKKDFSWAGDFKGDAVKDFVKKEVDLLILYHNNDQYLENIAAQSNAYFKVGFAGGDERILDLILAVAPSETAVFNGEILKYLKILGKL